MAYTTINKSTDHFNTKLYTGNGSTNAITGVGHQPDLTWIKNRNLSGGYGHSVFDSVRGVNKRIKTHTTSAEDTLSNSFNSFNSDGFTLGADSQTDEINISSGSQVSWNWKAGGAGSANTDGSISSTVSANAVSGFSIVTYTGNGTSGATVGHGLSSALGMLIVKSRSEARNWSVFHQSNGGTKNLSLDTTDAVEVNAARWNNTAPTSSVFTLGNSTPVNNNGITYVAYCFAEKQGYSKFGSYTGNGSTDGTFVYTGFKPAWVMVKRSDGAGDWAIMDTKRNTFNVMNKYLRAQGSDAEGTDASFDIDAVSNGFKLRYNNGNYNASGGNYIYMCFAEEPLVGDNPATAR